MWKEIIHDPPQDVVAPDYMLALYMKRIATSVDFFTIKIMSISITQKFPQDPS